jgi:flavin-dependent dehydrogenase
MRLRAEYLVVGAGPAGLTVARLLAAKGRAVIVVDPALRAARRLELLAPASLHTIAALGLTALMDDPVIARPCLGIRRQWGAAEPEYEDFLRHPRRTGYVIDRLRFDDRLRDAAVAAGVEFLAARVSGLEPDGGALRLAMNDGREETVPFTGTIIDATGRAAAIARRKGARIAMRDRMVAELIEESCVEPGASPPAWLEVQKQDASSWSYRIHGVGGHAQTWRIRRSGTAAAPHAIRQVDASACMLSEAAGEGWIAVGDAASAFDPVASQGLFNALSSGLVAAGALLSGDGLSGANAQLYSDAVAAAFVWSEAGRSSVYGNSVAIR